MYNPAEEISSINFGSIIGGALNAVVNAQRESADTTVNFIRKVGFMPGEVDAETGVEKGLGAPVCVSFAYDKEVSPSQVQTVRNITVEVKDGGSGYDETKDTALTVNGNIISGANIEYDGGKIAKVTLTAIPSGDFIKNGVSVIASQDNEDGTKNASAKLELSVAETNTPVPALYQKMQIDVPILTMMPIPFIKIENADIEFNVKINSVSSENSSDVSKSDVNSSSSFGYKGWGFSASTTLNASFSNQKSTSSSEEVKKDYSLNIKVHAVQDDMPAGVSRILDILEESIITKTVSDPIEKSE
ncbi:DUF2589 domain-containing protein [Ruminococcus sp. Marseille-P6503]|uniref:DUF2589 domain-containing protein n=1 Tax=Ruminococcus sp. Marseille-P6503 TaxID=2364796 RepID=UPI000F536A17|nr:DUF2589 domain-containing protein [Ruminococcus sp. Marseille-P6503]